jgi:rod shape determining protein RodA
LCLFIIVAAGTPPVYLLVLVSPALAALASTNLAILLIFLALLIFFAWRLRIRLLFLILLVVANFAISFATPHLWNQLKPYQKSRLISFIQPEADPRGSGYQVIQSKVAIGSGSLTGKGLGQGSQTQLKFLPEQHTDFIFSVLGEELGFIGATLALTLFSLLIYRCFRTAFKSKGRYSALVCTGLASMLTFHIFINIGMTLGIMPVTGLPLPLLSYGGSFLWTVMISLGLILGIQSRWREYTP